MSDVKKEYDQLMILVDKTKKGEVVDTKEVLSLNNKVFSMLKTDLAEGSSKEKEEASILLKEYLLLLVEMSNKKSEEGTEEQKDLMAKAHGVLKRAGIEP